MKNTFNSTSAFEYDFQIGFLYRESTTQLRSSFLGKSLIASWKIGCSPWSFQDIFPDARFRGNFREKTRLKTKRQYEDRHGIPTLPEVDKKNHQKQMFIAAIPFKKQLPTRPCRVGKRKKTPHSIPSLPFTPPQT